MAQDNNITIAFKGTGSDKLRNQINSIAEAQERLNGKVGHGAKAGNGLLKNNRLLGGSFATMRSHLLLFNFAMGMGIRQLVGFAKESAKVESMSKAFNTLAGGSDKSSMSLRKLKVATNGTMSEFDLFQQANNAMVLGITKNSDEMAEMFDVAQRLGRALGKDTASSVESLVTGIGRQSRLMLDNIGIIVKADEAYESYAEELGISADKLTDVDKKQAFLNATMESARKKVKMLGEEQITTQDSFDSFSASMSDLSNSIGRDISPTIVSFLQGSSNFMKEIAETNLETAVRQLQEMGVALSDLKELNELMSIENATAAFIGNNKKIQKEIQGNIHLTDNMLIGLGATFKQIEVGSVKSGKGIKRVVDEFDAASLSATHVRLIIKGIQANNNQLSASMQTANEKERVGIEENIGFNADRMAIMAKILQLVLERNKAEEVLLGIKKDQDKGDGDSGVELFIKNADKVKLVTGHIRALGSALSSAERSGEHMGMAIEKALKQIASQIISQMAVYALAATFIPSLGLTKGAGAALKFGLGIAHTGGHIKDDGSVQRFATGGMVQGQDNVPILAQAGEYVMQRSAVESVGLEAMNRINQGGSAGNVVINVSGNVMSQDYVEGELADQLRTAIRRGADIGVS